MTIAASRQCPTCNRTINYTTVKSCDLAEQRKSSCLTCGRDRSIKARKAAGTLYKQHTDSTKKMSDEEAKAYSIVCREKIAKRTEEVFEKFNERIRLELLAKQEKHHAKYLSKRTRTI